MTGDPRIEPGLKNDRMVPNGPGATPGGNFSGAATMLALAGAAGWRFFAQQAEAGQSSDPLLVIVGIAVLVTCVGMAAYLIWYGVRRLRWRRRNAARTGGVRLGMWERSPAPRMTPRGSYPAEPRSRWARLVAALGLDPEAWKR